MLRRFAAALAVVGILIGMPIVLIALGATPSGVPSWDTLRSALTSPDDGTLLLGLLKVAGWLAWAALIFSMALEAVARMRGRSAATIRGLGGPQRLARALLGAIFLTSSVVVPSVAHAAPTGTVATTSAGVTAAAAAAPATAPPPASTAPTAVPAASPAKPAPPTITHTITRGDTLWGLAEQYLGEGRRYPEILALNSDVLAGGADFLRTGWELRIPALESSRSGAPEVSTYIVQAGDTLRGIAEKVLGDPDRYQEIVDATAGTRQADGGRLVDPDRIEPGWTLTMPGPVTSSAAAPASEKPAPAPARERAPVPEVRESTTEQAPAPRPAPAAPATPPTSSSPQADPAPAAVTGRADADQDSPWMPLLPIGIGAVMAAGLTTLLTGRRRELQRARRPGQRLPDPPTEAAAQLERSMRAGADPLSPIDALLRQLAVNCTAAGTPVPAVRAARATATQIDLYLETPASLPAPWEATSTATVWTTPTPTGALDTPVIPAPYPTLVTIGRDTEDGHILLNLEQVGALDINAGDHQDRAREILAALAVELASSTWADDVRVTIIGACADLEDALQTGRITYLPTIARYLDGLEQRATADRGALTTQDTTLLDARAQGVVRDAWAPEVVLTAVPLSESHQERLTTLLTGQPRVAIAVVTNGTPITDWAIVLDDTDPTSAVLHPAGLSVTPQHLPADSYRALLATADLVRTDELVTVEDAPPEPTLSNTPTTIPAFLSAGATVLAKTVPTTRGANTAHVDTAPAIGDDTATEPVVDEPATADQQPSASDESDSGTGDAQDTDEELTGPITIKMLGHITLEGARGSCEPSRQARLTELAAYLALHPGASHTDIDDAIWPNRTKNDNTATRHPVSTRLRAWLGTADDGAEFFPRHQNEDRGYRLHDVTTDIAQWDALIRSRPFAASTEDLTTALQLVHGRPFTGPRIRYYGWAETVKHRLIAEIVDASYELARRHYMSSHWRDAERALAIGLDIEPAQERLHRLRILTCHEARDIAARGEAIDRMRAVMDELDLPLEPETEDLLAALADPTRLDDARSAI
jgi:nucleoid-associated protein YgaU/DNA-binding SARP family transcriptional activator